MYRIRSDGRQQTRLTHNNLLERLPAWSPNARWISYATNDLNEFRIFRLDLRDLSSELLAEGAGYVHKLNWSADGDALIYETNNRRAQQVWTVAADGGEPQLTGQSLDEAASIVLAPDGDWLAFTEYLSNGTLALYRARLDGAERQTLHENLAGDTAFRWSPLFDLPVNTRLLLLMGLVITGIAAAIARA